MGVNGRPLSNASPDSRLKSPCRPMAGSIRHNRRRSTPLRRKPRQQRFIRTNICDQAVVQLDINFGHVAAFSVEALARHSTDGTEAKVVRMIVCFCLNSVRLDFYMVEPFAKVRFSSFPRRRESSPMKNISLSTVPNQAILLFAIFF